MTPEVEEAIEELRTVFPDLEIVVDAETQGGAYVTVRNVFLGGQYQPDHSWIGFLLPYTYPNSDVYPHFTDPTLSRTDGQTLNSAFQRTSWRDQLAIQMSRRSPRWNPNEDTAVLKLQKVLAWLAEQ